MADGGRKAAVPGLHTGAALSGLLRQWIRFIVVGGVNTAFSYGVYAAAIFAGAGYALASAGSMIAGILFSYRTTRRLVFRNAVRGSLPRFIACYVIVYAFSVMLLERMDAYGISPYVSGIIVAMPAALLSFGLLKLLVFRDLRSR